MNQIYNNNCFDVFDALDDNIVNMVLVDLPYGQTNCDWDIKIDLNEMWKCLKRICKDNCIYAFFTTTKFGFELISSNPKWFRYDIIWEKHISVGFLNANKMPLRAHEMIYIFSDPQIKNKIYHPQKTPGKPYKTKESIIKKAGVYGKETKKMEINNISGDRHPRSVLKFHQSDKKVHPTQKPVELCEWFIKTYSNEDDLIMDFCMGSGSSIIAAINTNRNFIGVEMNETIYETTKKRISDVI